MANRFAVASGNFNDTATWSTTAAGDAGASVPVAGDNAIANNRTVTITDNATCDDITNGTTYGGTAGGGFVLTDAITLTVLSSVLTGGAGGTIRLTGTDSATVAAVSITSSKFGGSCILHSGTGTLTVNCTTVQGNGYSGAVSNCINVSAAGVLNLTASTITGGAETLNLAAGAVFGSASSTVNVSAASIFGGSQPVSPALNCAGICFLTGNAYSTVSCSAVFTYTTTNLTIVGSVTAANGRPTILGTPTNSISVSGSFIYSVDGTPPTTQKVRLNSTPTAAKTRYALNGSGTYVDMFTADNTGLAPAVTDVRAGVVYGSATGTCSVPAAGSVALGAPVDNTTGTAVLTPEAVWGYASRETTGGTVDTLTNAPAVPTAAAIAAATRTELATELACLDATVSSRLAPSGTLATVTTLTNAPTVPTAAAIASQVRAELTTELGRIDANVASRAASGTLASDISAIKAKTDGVNVERINDTATLSQVGTLLAQANS
jgi:hypothetical protein